MTNPTSPKPSKDLLLLAHLRQALLFAALLLLTMAPLGALQAQAELAEASPEAVVERLEEMLINNMKSSDTIGFQQRFERLRPLLEQIMAVERMGRYVFGRDWRDFDPDARRHFNKTFLDLSAATYAGQFDAHNGEAFEPIEVQRQSEDRAVVRRRLITGSGRKVAFDYLMTRDEGGWQIVTIITDGVSDLAIKRGQYRRVLESDGFEAVIEHISEAIDKQRGD
ncbi:MAG: ABC transporter substrate-binding protein [Xanthomonadaceae bacterium]|nr:ABC transporter substrate-binding protein [Xanthomonadaceae bacterium]